MHQLDQTDSAIQRLIMFLFPYHFQPKVIVTFNTGCVGEKDYLTQKLENVVNKPASGLVRFSYKLSVFQIVGFVLCHPEAAGV